ncbi:MAG TPA: hypothetical protein VMT71_14895 [Syntrophorhabdales bacterium]|nr:hypothetical protein [Syntrophorhabdales bacterium]
MRKRRAWLEVYRGELLTENEKMLAVYRKLGFSVEPTDDDMTKVILPLK